MKPTIGLLLLLAIGAAGPAVAEESAGGGGSASGQTLGFEAEVAASVKPMAAPVERPAASPPAGATGGAECRRAAAVPGIMAISPGRPVELHGVLESRNGSQLTIITRTGEKLTVDGAPALQSGEATILVPGGALSIQGSAGPDGVVHADVIQRAKGVPASWRPDCKS